MTTIEKLRELSEMIMQEKYSREDLAEYAIAWQRSHYFENPPVEIDAAKWEAFCKLWDDWNNRDKEAHETLLEIGTLFKKEFRGYRKRLDLRKNTVAITSPKCTYTRKRQP